MLRIVSAQSKFNTLSAALDDLPNAILSGDDTLTIELAPGVYHERIFTQIPRLEIRGTGRHAEDTRIEYGLGAKHHDASGEPLGTFRTPTLHCESDYITLENLTIANIAGKGKIVGQAIALSLNARNAVVRQCRLLGDQDTLFLAPLPPSPKQAKGFLGSEIWQMRPLCASYFENCYIEGGVDFIFGGGAAYFERCQIVSLPPSDIGNLNHEKPTGYITAASTPEHQAHGLIFHNCHLESDCPAGTVYLGRPWREFAQTTFNDCHLGAHVHPQGWHDWLKPEAHTTTRYIEIRSSGPGANSSERVYWASTIESMQLSTDKCIPEDLAPEEFLELYDF